MAAYLRSIKLHDYCIGPVLRPTLSPPTRTSSISLPALVLRRRCAVSPPGLSPAGRAAVLRAAALSDSPIPLSLLSGRRLHGDGITAPPATYGRPPPSTRPGARSSPRPGPRPWTPRPWEPSVVTAGRRRHSGAELGCELLQCGEASLFTSIGSSCVAR